MLFATEQLLRPPGRYEVEQRAVLRIIMQLKDHLLSITFNKYFTNRLNVSVSRLHSTHALRAHPIKIFFMRSSITLYYMGFENTRTLGTGQSPLQR